MAVAKGDSRLKKPKKRRPAAPPPSSPNVSVFERALEQVTEGIGSLLGEIMQRPGAAKASAGMIRPDSGGDPATGSKYRPGVFLGAGGRQSPGLSGASAEPIPNEEITHEYSVEWEQDLPSGRVMSRRALVRTPEEAIELADDMRAIGYRVTMWGGNDGDRPWEKVTRDAEYGGFSGRRKLTPSGTIPGDLAGASDAADPLSDPFEIYDEHPLTSEEASPRWVEDTHRIIRGAAVHPDRDPAGGGHNRGLGNNDPFSTFPRPYEPGTEMMGIPSTKAEGRADIPPGFPSGSGDAIGGDDPYGEIMQRPGPALSSSVFRRAQAVGPPRGPIGGRYSLPEGPPGGKVFPMPDRRRPTGTPSKRNHPRIGQRGLSSRDQGMLLDRDLAELEAVFGPLGDGNDDDDFEELDLDDLAWLDGDDEYGMSPAQLLPPMINPGANSGNAVSPGPMINPGAPPMPAPGGYTPVSPMRDQGGYSPVLPQLGPIGGGFTPAPPPASFLQRLISSFNPFARPRPAPPRQPANPAYRRAFRGDY